MFLAMERRLKVGITCYPTFGGSGVVATELGLALAEAGHDVHFISSRLPARLRRHITADVSFHEVNTYSYALFQHEPYSLALAAKMAEVAETFGLDLLHVHYAIPHAISAHLAREMLEGRVRIVTTLHGTDITLVGADPSLHRITRFAINQSDAVTAVSHWLAEETRREFSPSPPVQVVPNFIDTREFHTSLGEGWAGRHYACPGHPHLIHVSNFRPVKRAFDAVRILAKVLKHTDAHLLMVGDGPDLPEAVRLVRELEVSERVTFMGNREDVAYLLAASDVMLMPSGSESFGLSALEAMACGCAVVASNIGGLPELIRHGIDGWLCDVGDVDMMAQRVLELLSNSEQHKDMCHAARERAVKDFDTSAVLPRYLEIYSELLESKQVPRAG
jgi:N-acetyl-alpha-D-glucosaminyl L-malate synthase BshA